MPLTRSGRKGSKDDPTGKKEKNDADELDWGSDSDLTDEDEEMEEDGEELEGPGTGEEKNVGEKEVVSEKNGESTAETGEIFKVEKRRPGRPPKRASLGGKATVKPTPKTASSEPGRRGRKPKAEIKDEDKFVPDPTKRGIMAEGSSSLRRRDKIKSTSRYSPEPFEPTRQRGKGGNISFPSTSSSSKYISLDSDEEIIFAPTNDLAPPKRAKSVLTIGGNVNSYSVDVKKDVEGKKMVIMLPDGTTYSVETGGSHAKADYSKQKGEDEIDMEDDGEVDDPEDDDYKPSSSGRKSAGTATATSGRNRFVRNTNSSSSTTTTGKSVTTNQNKVSALSGPKKSVVSPKFVPRTTIAFTTPSPMPGTTTTKITSAGKTTKVTFITTPKSMTLTPASTVFRQPPKRSYGSATKFIDELPDLNECTNDENDSSLSRLPDKISLITSDLPLKYSTGIDNQSNLHVFRQVISPVMTAYPCLLCRGNKIQFNAEKDLLNHYSSLHELSAEMSSARFSEDTVFVCLPRHVMEQMKESDATILLNAPCQYCGNDIKLATVDDMKQHYSSVHDKEIELIEQEEILGMHNSVYCCKCSEKSSDFGVHHKHMKEVHKMHTFACKQCPFMTQDQTRLRTHYKAKHMMSHTNHNIHCPYCNGLLVGSERLNKHIMSSHCIQTAQNEWSCVMCLQPCGKSDELMSHTLRCTAMNGPQSASQTETNDTQQQIDEVSTTTNPLETKNGGMDKNDEETTCFLCKTQFETEKECEDHLHHVHTKWVTRNVLHDTFLMVRHPNGKTDLMPKSPDDSSKEVMKISDLPVQKQLERLGVSTGHGHHCFKCDTTIKLYQLYYLHMHNVHRLRRMFQCCIMSCKQSFKTHSLFEDHILQTGHTQTNVIDDPLSSIACHYCDGYFIDDNHLHQHQITEEHINKINSLIDRTGNRPEPRNFKCKTCHTWFGLNDAYIYHLENETHKHPCPYCGLHSALPSSRRAHIQSYHPEKVDVCEICSVKQGTKERLFAHLIQHNIIFECNKCMRKFYQKEQLNSHMETHGEPVDCPWDGCGKKVPRSGLSNHIRLHRVEIESKCNSCGKVFSNRYQLASHLEVHTKAESNAKAILSTSTAKVTLTPTIHGMPSQQNDGHNKIARTTINITTVSEAAHNMTAIKPKIRPNIPTKSQQNQGIKMMCVCCNQLFNNQNALFLHKCRLQATVTVTPPPKTIQMKQEQEYPLTTVVPVDATMSDNLEVDPEKLLLDLAADVAAQAATEEAEKHKQKQMQRVESLLQSGRPGSDAQMVSQPMKEGYLIPRENQIIQELVNKDLINSPIMLQTTQRSAQVANKAPARVARPKVARMTKEEKLMSQEVDEQIKYVTQSAEEQSLAEQTEVTYEQNVIQSDDLNSGESMQLIMLMNEETGELMQVTAPLGTDINEIVKQINNTLAETGSGSVQPVTMVQSDGTTLATTSSQQMDAAETSQQQTEEFDADQQQNVLYLPVNDDGTLNIDSNLLKLLTGSENADSQTIIINNDN